jgi:hypothetical protein
LVDELVDCIAPAIAGFEQSCGPDDEITFGAIRFSFTVTRFRRTAPRMSRLDSPRAASRCSCRNAAGGECRSPR